MMKKIGRSPTSAWIVSVSMGYGHQRTAYPLKDLAQGGKIINANDYPGIPESDRKIWEASRQFYEFVSNFERLPLIGKPSFRIFDQFQKILKFYPKRDLSQPTFGLKRIFSLIESGWGKHLIETLKKEQIPFVTTFFTPAYMAEYFRYPGKIYCVVCDADISRSWAPLNPNSSRIVYLAPTNRVVERLMFYGVPQENIFLTGYPLPKENLGSKKLEIARRDLTSRLLNLDPRGTYRKQYLALIKKYLGRLGKTSSRPLTIMFSIGGAGAQKEIAAKAIKSLAKRIKEGFLRFIIASGGKEETKNYFFRELQALGLKQYIDKNVVILWDPHADRYFQKFNLVLRESDILWTKPSELSFYAALGIPIIIAPPLGSHEEMNREWLLNLGGGIPQEDPRYTEELLFDALDSGRFAEAATQGFIEAEKTGTFNIEQIVARGKMRS